MVGCSSLQWVPKQNRDRGDPSWLLLYLGPEGSGQDALGGEMGDQSCVSPQAKFRMGVIPLDRLDGLRAGMCSGRRLTQSFSHAAAAEGKGLRGQSKAAAWTVDGEAGKQAGSAQTTGTKD